jgi:hypothetical protein
MTDLDRASLDRLLPATPGAADWDDVMSRSAAFQSHRRRRLVVLAVAALVTVVGSAAAVGSVRDFVLDRGFICFPPQGATPSAPESGELVVAGGARSATLARGPNAGGQYVGPLVRLWVYADGRVVWDRREQRVPEGAKEFTSGLLEQRLTREGVELVRSEVVASGLFDRDLTLVVPDGHLTPGGHEGLFWGWAEAPGDGRLVRLGWSSPFYSTPGEGTTATPEQVSAIGRLDAWLSDPASVLPSSAWADPQVRAYVPSHYAVCVDTSPPTDIARLLFLLPARAEELLRGKGWTRSEGDVVEAREGYTVVLGRSVTYCSKLATDEAREVAEALSGLDPVRGAHSLAYLVAEAVDNLNPTTIRFEPYLPHGQFPVHGG